MTLSSVTQLVNRAGSSVASGMLPDPGELEPTIRAWHRALPMSRLLDYGMDPSDAHELLWRTAGGEDWFAVASEIGNSRAAIADAAVGSEAVLTARLASRSALAALNIAQVVINTDSDRKRTGYRAFLAEVARFASLTRGVEFLADADGFSALIVSPPEPRGGTVIVWGGLSGWGASFLGAAVAVAGRGLTCLLIDGPGQGNPRMERGIVAGVDAVARYGRSLDLAERIGLPGPFGVQGNSFGGLLAARVSAADERVRACVVNGAPARPVVPDFRTAREQIFAFLGTDDEARAAELLDDLAFAPALHSISVPTLILIGGKDPLVSRGEVESFIAGMKHADSTVLEWPDGEHTLYNHAASRDAFCADWFAAHLQTSTT